MVKGFESNNEWNNIEDFTKYYLVFDNYFELREENKVYLTKE